MKTSPLLKHSYFKNYGSLDQIPLSVRELEFNMSIYDSSWLFDFINQLDEITKMFREDIFPMKNIEVPSQIKCKGSKELIELASIGNFTLLEEKLENYPIGFDDESLNFRIILLMTALESSIFNTALIVFNWQHKNLGYFSGERELKEIYDTYLKRFQYKIFDTQFAKEQPKIIGQIRRFSYFNSLLWLRENNFNISQIQDIDKLKEFFRNQILEHNKEVISKNVNPKNNHFFSKSVEKEYQNDSTVISKLKIKLSDPAVVTQDDIAKYITEIVDVCRAKSNKNISQKLITRLDSIIVACATVRQLNSETKEIINQNTNEIIKDSFMPK